MVRQVPSTTTLSPELRPRDEVLGLDLQVEPGSSKTHRCFQMQVAKRKILPKCKVDVKKRRAKTSSISLEH
jgi:hypothetical protein